MYVSCVLLCSYCAIDSEILFIGRWNLRFGRHETDFFKTHKTPMPSLRERAIAEYHELLAADETLTPGIREIAQRHAQKAGCSTATGPSGSR